MKAEAPDNRPHDSAPAAGRSTLMVVAAIAIVALLGLGGITLGGIWAIASMFSSKPAVAKAAIVDGANLSKPAPAPVANHDAEWERLLSDPTAVHVQNASRHARGAAKLAEVPVIRPPFGDDDLSIPVYDPSDPLNQIDIDPERPATAVPTRPTRPSRTPQPKPVEPEEKDENWGVAQVIDFAELGAALEKGAARPGKGRRVMVKDEANRLVVAKVHVEIDDRLAVLLPDGQIYWLPAREATETFRSFTGLEKDELIARLTDEEFPGFKKGTTKRYVYIYNTSDAFYEATHSILETMYPKLVTYCQRLGLKVHEPELPMVVLMFRTEDEFQAHRRMPSGVVAYYDILKNCVVMYEQSRLSQIAPEIAIKQSITTIAHEGVHQILHNIGVQQRLSRWPMWISEGLPEYCAPTSVDRRVRWKGVGTINDLRMRSLAEVLQLSPPSHKSDGELVRQAVSAPRLDSDGYAVAWALTFYLAKSRPDDFAAYLQEISTLGPLAKDGRDQLEVFQEFFGDDFGGIQDKMLATLRNAK